MALPHRNDRNNLLNESQWPSRRRRRDSMTRSLMKGKPTASSEAEEASLEDKDEVEPHRDDRKNGAKRGRWPARRLQKTGRRRDLLTRRTMKQKQGQWPTKRTRKTWPESLSDVSSDGLGTRSELQGRIRSSSMVEMGINNKKIEVIMRF